MDNPRVEMFDQCAPIHIEDAIRILRKIKKKYGEIPIAGFNGDGVHIEVFKSDKPLESLSTVFTYKSKMKRISDCCLQGIPKKNPTPNYVYIW